jgi:iron complex outermembrane receptor protein
MGLFYNDIADFIFAEEQDDNGDGVADRVEPDFLDTGLVVDESDALLLVRQTQRDAHFWGFEFESRFMVFEDRRGRLDWRLWSDYVEGRLSGGDTVPRLPPLRFGTGLAWSRDAWTTELRLTRVTDQDDTSALELPTNGYTLLDVHAEYTVPLPGDRALVFFARGNNLLDEEVRRHTSFLKEQAPQPGASGLFGFRCLF